MRGINFHEDFGWSNAPRIPMSAAVIGGGSAIGGLGSIIGGGKSSSASKQAAQQSLMGTIYGIQNQQAMFSSISQKMDPYVNAGHYWVGQLGDLAGQPSAGQPYLNAASNELAANDSYRTLAQDYLGQASNMLPGNVLTQANLEQTPGYQFTLAQGLKSTLAANAARGLGVSGASLKGAAQYATGLADATYSNRFNEAQQNWADVINQSNQALNLGANAQNTATGYVGQGSLAQQMQQQKYNQAYNIASLGENAAAMTGNAGTAAANAISSGITAGTSQAGNYLQNAGQAQAAGTVGVGNAINSGINNYLAYNALSGLNNTLQGATTSGFVGGTMVPFNGYAPAMVPGQVAPGGFVAQ